MNCPDAPWCSHCKALAPEFTRLAQLLEEEKSEIILAKVDATAEKELAQRYQVGGFPTLKLFRKGHEKPVECKTPHRAGEMFVWLRKKLGSPVDKLDSVEEVKKLVEDSIVFVMGFFKVVYTLIAHKHTHARAHTHKQIEYVIHDSFISFDLSSELYLNSATILNYIAYYVQ